MTKDILRDHGLEVIRKSGVPNPDNDSFYRINTNSFPKANRSSFGDIMCEMSEPIAQISATYGKNSDTEVFQANGGSLIDTQNMYELSCGTNVGGYSVLRTKRAVIYREGQGLSTRFTAQFDSNAVANSLQFAGLFNLTDSVAFGYRGVDFGIIYDTYGAPEIRTLNITTAGNGSLTLTLNSINYIIPITTGTQAHNAYEIETWMRANQSAWNAQQNGNSVIFQNRSVGPMNGTYGVTGAGLVGNFTQQQLGVVQEQVTIKKEDFNKDLADWHNPNVFNVYMIKMAYLGFGPLQFFIMHPDSSEFILVHEIRSIGTRAKPNVSKRAMKTGWIVASLGSTTDLTVRGASAGIFIDGESRVISPVNASSSTNSSVGADFEGVVSVRAKQVYKNKVMLGRIVPEYIEIANDGTKPVEFTIIKNASFGETNYVSYGDESIAEIANNNGLLTGTPERVYSGVMSAGGSKTVSMVDLNIDIQLNETLTVFARKTTGTDVSVTAAIIWKEDY